jgi:hypothetical protein
MALNIFKIMKRYVNRKISPWLLSAFLSMFLTRRIFFIILFALVDQAHCGFYLPWQFMVAFKDFETKASWFTNEAQINLKIHQRSIPTVDGTPPFKYFDGASMMEYLFPSKTSEIVYCRRNPTPAGCDKGHGFEIDRIEFPIDDLYVGPSSLGEKAGRGTFTSRDLPAKSYVGLRELVHAVYADPATYRLIRHWRKPRKHWTFEKYWGPTVWSYIDGYGHAFNRRVSVLSSFSSSLLLFSQFIDSIVSC